MIKNGWLLLVAFAFAAGCATQEPPKPAPPPEPEVKPAPPPPPPPPAPKPKPAAEKVTFAGTIHFDFDRAVLKPDGKATLDEVASKIRGINLEVVIAIGHADMIGSDSYNQKLSVSRAEAIKAYLVSKGIEPNRVYTEGKGKKQPVTGDKCKKMGPAHRSNKKLVECLAPDRRVEIEVIGTRQP
jgi:OOP family OmpA-OmpF porin